MNDDAQSGPLVTDAGARAPGEPIRNYTSDEGRALGKIIAKWCDDAEPKARLRMPELPPRCASCAFREGPHLASGSPATQMDALKCVMEGKEFYCHDVHREGSLCSGWAMFMLAMDAPEFGNVPWDFVGGVTLPRQCGDNAETMSSGARAKAAPPQNPTARHIIPPQAGGET
jgi:hypothetical protein